MSRRSFAATALFLTALALATAGAHADKIKTVSGPVVQGYVVAETPQAFVVALPSGIESHIKKDDVASIEVERDPTRLKAAAEGFLGRQKFSVAGVLFARIEGDVGAADLKRMCDGLTQAQAACRQEDFAEAASVLAGIPEGVWDHPALAAMRESLAAARGDVLRKIDVAILCRNLSEADRLLARQKPAGPDMEFRRRERRAFQDRADLLFFREEPAAALAIYEEMLRRDPDLSGEVRMRLAWCRARAILDREAPDARKEEQLAALLDFEPGLQIAHRALGRAAYARNDREAAVRHFRALLDPARDLPVEEVPSDVEELKYLATRVAVKPRLEDEAEPLLPRTARADGPWQTRETPHFTIHHRDAGTAAAVAIALEHYLRIFGEEVLGPGQTWTPERKRALYLYRSPEDRKGTEPVPHVHNLGSATTAIGILGDGDDLIADALPHELVHLIQAEKRWVLPIWAAEGLALALQRSARRTDAFAQVQRALEDGREIPMEDLLGAAALTGRDAAFYQRFTAQAWTIVDWLIDRKGGILNFHRFAREVEDRFKIQARKLAEAKRYEGKTAVAVQVEITLAMSLGALREVYAFRDLRALEDEWRDYVVRLTRGESTPK